MARQPCLRMACHNVNGFAAKLHALNALWKRLALDIVAVIDTHVNFMQRTSLEISLKLLGWHSFWCVGYAGQHSTRAGVALLVRSGLIASGVLRVVGPICAPVAGCAQGRLLHVPIEWAGQHLDVVAVYLHASDPTANAAIIRDNLAPFVQHQQPRNVVVLGDFNFVSHPALDRRQVLNVQQQPFATHDHIPAVAWQQHMSPMCDVWRHAHATRKAFTYVTHTAASRLDRIYVSPAMLHDVAVCWHAERFVPISDHLPVVMTLLPVGHGALGPGLKSKRLPFNSDVGCRTAMQQWLVSQQPPDDPAVLLDQWYPAFLTNLCAKIDELNSAAAHHRAAARAADYAATIAMMTLGHQQLATCADAALMGVMAVLLTARTNLARLKMTAEQHEQQHRRQQWVHSGERPGPLLSKLLKPPKAATYIRCLRAPGSGHLVRSGIALSHIVGQHYAAVTATPVTHLPAQQAVLQALTQHSTPLPVQDAAVLGQPTVAVEEVLAAIQGLTPGKSPGIDGLPCILFRQYGQQLAPLLAAVYSAMGTLQRVPDGFLNGVIVPIYKPGGDELDPGCYRPIQLLNYMYRILAKVLAARLLKVVGGIIHPAQCAFLPQRHIKDSIRLLQVLPAVLQAHGLSAVAVFTDFTKAYDTLDRRFLYDVAKQLGLGDGFVNWMKLLLSNTRTCALVNGFKSALFTCHAGVRQGCPLAPILYLLIGEALWCFLKHKGVGVTVNDHTVVTAQYADDAEPFVSTSADVPAFVSTMHDFGLASGQFLNMNKSKLMLVGHSDTSAANTLPAHAAGMQIVSQAKALGVFYDNAGQSTTAWSDRLDIVKHRMQSISHIPNMSAFGRAFAVNAYALSTFLYGAQFACKLPTDASQLLCKWSAALVDRGLGPTDDLRRPPGIPFACMSAHPRDGGLGLLPVHHHLLSRWACEGIQLVFSTTVTPWVVLGRLLWHRWASVAGGAVSAAPDTMLGFMLCERKFLFPDDSQPQCLLPQPLRVMAQGLRALPPVRLVAAGNIDVAASCWLTPLWANPLFAVTQQWDWFGNQREVVVGLECVVPASLLHLPHLQCLGQAIVLLHKLQHVCAQPQPATTLAQHALYNVGIWAFWLQHRPVYANCHVALQHLQMLIGFLPTDWVAAAEQKFAVAEQLGRLQEICVFSNVETAAARAQLEQQVGWQLCTGSFTRALRPADVTVALATRLQRLTSHMAIAQRHVAFLNNIALLEGLQQPPQAWPAVTSVLARWWRLSVPNTYKEAAWRLTLNAFPTTERMLNAAAPCPACGALNPGQQHYFWSCPVAVAVRLDIERQLIAFGLLPEGLHIACSAVWLACLPHRQLHRLIWDMVCLAAIHACEFGRRTAWAVSHQANVPNVVELVAVRAAKAAFWEALADFAATVKIRDRARVQSLTHQPFISWHVVLVQGSGLHVVMR